LQVGWTALFSASDFGHTAIMQALLDAGADLHAKDKVRPPRRRPAPPPCCPLILSHPPCAHRCRHTSQRGSTALDRARTRNHRGGWRAIVALLEAAEQAAVAVPVAEAPVGGEAATFAAELTVGVAAVSVPAPLKYSTAMEDSCAAFSAGYREWR
jgi:hypothetical protein